MTGKRSIRRTSKNLDSDESEDYDDNEDYEGDWDVAENFDSGKKAKTLASALAPKQLREYGWNRSYERGESYYRAGAVTSLVQNRVHINAAVQGTPKYKTHIWLEGGRLRFTCTCPAGGFCKHLIATALAWNKGEAEVLGDLDDISAPNGKISKAHKKAKAPDLSSHLLSMDKESLVSMLLEQAMKDDGLRESLNLSAAVANPDGIDLASLRQRIDKALEFPDYSHDPELRDLLAREYRRKRRNADAMELYWSEFVASPHLERYKELKKQAAKENAWNFWRTKALEHIREKIAAAQKKNERRPRGGGWNSHYDDFARGDDHSLLVEILLWEKKPEEAWNEAKTGDCSEAWWLRLAAWREKANPEDCIPIWRRRIERLTQCANQNDYVPAAESLAKAVYSG